MTFRSQQDAALLALSFWHRARRIMNGEDPNPARVAVIREHLQKYYELTTQPIAQLNQNIGRYDD